MDLKKLDDCAERMDALAGRLDSLRDRKNAATSALIHWGRRGAGSEPACGRNAASTYARERYESFPEDARCQLCQRAYEKMRDKTGGTFSFKKADAEELPANVKEQLRNSGVGGVFVKMPDGREALIKKMGPEKIEQVTWDDIKRVAVY